MDEGIRRNKGGTKLAARSQSTAARSLYERRPLKTVTLTPPEYKVPNHILADSYLEKQVRYAGSVPNIPVHLDCTNRTDVLRVIDRGKQEKRLPWVTSFEHDAILSLNVHNVKISRRDGNEELFLRLPIHEIAATCYIRDEEQHILAIKFGSYKVSRGLVTDADQDLCQLSVMFCDSRGSAEELCALIGQCFQLVYTDATMHFLDTKLTEATAGSSTLRSDKSSANSTPKRDRLDRQNLAFLSRSNLELEQANGTLSSVMSQSLPRTRRNSTARSDSISELSATANEMIHTYMKKLYTKLNTDELRRFAMLVKAWHTNMAFTDFCEKVLELYGPDRKVLLLGMRPFIPEKDTGSFETFLERIGVGRDQTMTGTGTYDTISSGIISRHARRAYSGASLYGQAVPPGSGEGSLDSYDQQLNDISHQIENLGTAVEMNHASIETSLNLDRDNIHKTT